MSDNKHGTTWLADLPCPRCTSRDVIGFLLVNEDGEHQHTKYRCTRWDRGAKTPCGWEGWFVSDASDEPMTPPTGDDELFSACTTVAELVPYALPFGAGRVIDDPHLTVRHVGTAEGDRWRRVTFSFLVMP